MRWLKVFAALWRRLLDELKKARQRGRDETVQEAHRDLDRRAAEADDISNRIDRMDPDERERMRQSGDIYRD